MPLALAGLLQDGQISVLKVERPAFFIDGVSLFHLRRCLRVEFVFERCAVAPHRRNLPVDSRGDAGPLCGRPPTQGGFRGGRETAKAEQPHARRRAAAPLCLHSSSTDSEGEGVAAPHPERPEGLPSEGACALPVATLGTIYERWAQTAARTANILEADI